MPRAEDVLREIAADQAGLVTARQADAEGIGGARLVQLERRGRLERLSRGLYRFPTWPNEDLQQYHRAVLWPQAHRSLEYALVSHESAAELYNLTQLNPAVVHVTVPRTVRIAREVPLWLRLHFEDVAEEERTYERGAPTVMILKAIEQIAPHGLDVVHRAVSEARERRLLREDELARLARTFGSVVLEPYVAQ
jgi:predicted transcriptional regulator of viral defense system